MIEVNLTEDCSFYVQGDRFEFIQQKIDNIIMIASLFNYECVINRFKDYIRINIAQPYRYVYTLKFYLNDSNVLQSTSINYINSDGLARSISTGQHSIKRILKKAEYLIK